MNKSENILAFENALKESKELLEKFNAAKKRIIENKEAESDAGLIVKAATEVGFTLTEAELERAMAQMQEISDEELENVAGGFDWCMKNFSCFIIYDTSDYTWA